MNDSYFDKKLLEEKNIALKDIVRYIQWGIMGLLLGLLLTLILMTSKVASWKITKVDDSVVNTVLLDLTTCTLLISCIAIFVVILIGIAQILQPVNPDLVQAKLLLARLNKLTESNISGNNDDKIWENLWKSRPGSKKISAITCLILIAGALIGLIPLADMGRQINLVPITKCVLLILIAIIIGIIIGICISSRLTGKQQKVD